MRKRERNAQAVGVGSVIGGRYELVRFVAEGAFGAVYQAHDLDVAGHVVALKLMHRPPASEEEKAMHLREVQLIAAVSHPSVVSFKDYGVHAERLYIVMPWYDGESLAARLRGGVGLTRAEALRIFQQLAQALVAIHARGIRHQDIKPENILLARFGEGQADFPVLLDLGVGAFAHEVVPAFTPAYVAPEMARAHLGMGEGGSVLVDGRADVYALALTLFDALAPGQRQLSECDGSLASLAQRAEQGATLPKLPALADLTPSFARWLAVDPTARPTAQEFVEELSVLTRAELRRAERKRLWLRAGPFLSAALVFMGVLGKELREERVLSRTKDARIEQQAEEIDQVRDALGRLSEAQRAQLLETMTTKAENEELGAKIESEAEKRAALQKALQREQREVREKESALKEVTEKNAELTASLTSVRKRADELEQERARLMSELARVEAAHRTLASEHAALAKQKTELEASYAALRGEHGELARAHEKLARERAELETEREKLAAQLRAAEREKTRLTERVDGLSAQQRKLANDLRALETSPPIERAAKRVRAERVAPRS